jgi:hypothetical protein
MTALPTLDLGRELRLYWCPEDCSAIEAKRRTVSLKVEREELLNQRLCCCLMRAAG